MNLKWTFMALLLAIGWCIAVPGLAQNRTITGIITDTARHGIGGVSVLVKGTGTGTQTANDGTFTLNITSATASTLVVSSVGYVTQEVPIGDGNNINVVLKSANNTLADVVVIGYGTVRRRDQTGSISTVTSKDFNPGNNTTPEQLIVGKVPGVNITPNGGQPGQGSTIRIRQGASLNASNDPLIVVDGVPLTGGLSGTGGSQNSGVSNPLSLINPADIETFTVLKDAASTAIYGSRASNGVILITTKKGRSGKPTVNISSQVSAATIPSYVPVLSAGQLSALVDSFGNTLQKGALGTANTDWQKEIYRTAIGTNNNASIAGSFKNINMPYRVSFNYYNQNGLLKTDNLERYTGGIRLNPRLLDDHLRIDVNLNGAITNTRFANQGAIGSAIAMDPTQPVYKSGSPWGGYFEYSANDTTPSGLATRNPLALLEQRSDIGRFQKVYGNVQFDYKVHFLPDLHANLNLGYEGSKGDGNVNVANNAAQNWGTTTASGTGQGFQSKYLQKISNKTLEFYLNYNKDITSIKSNINATAGYGYYDYQTTNYNYPNLYANGDTIINSIPTFPFDKPRYTLISYYGRLIYTLNNKYVLMASIRTDGSSRFAEANRWGVFPAVALTWKMNQEGFLKNATWLNQLNLRASYGETGNQEGISLYSYIPTYSLSTNASLYQIGNNFYHVYAPVGYNSNIQWEQTATFDVGVDYAFLNNRINGSIDYYDKKTTNLLNTVNVTPGTNFANQITANVGSMTTKGLEFLVNVIPVQTKSLTWNVGFNIAYNDRKITKLTVVEDPTYRGIQTGSISGGTGSLIQLTSVNHQPNAFFVYKQVYDEKTGKPIEGLYADLNHDGQINEADRYQYKSPYPRYNLGFNTSVRMDKWTLSTTLHGNLGNYVYNNIASNKNNIAALFNNSAGTLQNITTGIYTTMFQTRQLFSDYYVENGSFLRMDNVSLAYDFGRIANNKLNLTISGTVQNVFIITKYTGVNPEVYSGIDNNLYPIPRVYTLGVNVNF